MSNSQRSHHTDEVIRAIVLGAELATADHGIADGSVFVFIRFTRLCVILNPKRNPNWYNVLYVEY